MNKIIVQRFERRTYAAGHLKSFDSATMSVSMTCPPGVFNATARRSISFISAEAIASFDLSYQNRSNVQIEMQHYNVRTGVRVRMLLNSLSFAITGAAGARCANARNGPRKGTCTPSCCEVSVGVSGLLPAAAAAFAFDFSFSFFFSAMMVIAFRSAGLTFV